MEWVEQVQRLKPGAAMPEFDLPAKEAASLSAYLSSLQ